MSVSSPSAKAQTPLERFLSGMFLVMSRGGSLVKAVLVQVLCQFPRLATSWPVSG